MFSLWLRTRYEYRMRQRDSPFVSFAADTKHYELSIEPLTCCSSVGRATMVVPPAVACCHNAGRGAPMKKYGTFVGLDVHARSISACALDPLTGEITEGRFGAQAGALAEWALAFDSPPVRLRVGPGRLASRPRAQGPGRRLRRRRLPLDAEATRRQGQEDRPQGRRVPGAPPRDEEHHRGVGARRGVRGGPRPLARPRGRQV